MDFIIRAVGNSALDTLEKYIDFYALISKDGKSRMATKELQDYVAQGKDNRTRIKEALFQTEDGGLALVLAVDIDSNGNIIVTNVEVSISELVKADLYLLPHTVLAIPAYAFQKDFVRAEGNFIYRQSNLNAFFAKQLIRIFGNDEYRQNYVSGAVKNTYVKRYYEPTVWIWCKSLGYPEGTLLDISPFIKSITTNVADGGGNFSIELASIPCIFRNNTWQFDTNMFELNDIQQYYDKVATSSGVGGDGEMKATNYFFHNAITSNDVVFISFERFQGARPDYQQYGFEIPFSELPFYTPTTRVEGEDEQRDIYGNKIFNNQKTRKWDMIGLVDADRLVENPNRAVISIQGRDLFKLLIDDQEKFYPLEYADLDVYGVFNNAQGGLQETSRAIRRVDGELSAINVFVDNTLEEAISFIFSQLSHIEVCPDVLFSAYGDLRSYYLYAKDIQEISREYRTPVGEVINKLQSTTATPQKPTFKQVVSFEKILGAGIWQIIKILVDDDGTDSSLKIRRVVDSSIRTQQGSLLNYINRVAQYPFVEFYGDTYENQFYFIARKPPFTKEAYSSLLEVSDKIDVDGEGNFHIRQGDILSQEYTFDDSQVYSAYKINPTGNFLGENTTFTTAYLPAVFFGEYAEIWGLRVMEVESNFIDYVGTLRQNKKSQSLETLQEQAVEDLRYLVECHAFLPFSRKAKITVHGDRRYKKGMAVRNLATDEVYYIESVQQVYQVDQTGAISRQTQLELSHGIVDKIQGGINTFDLYFNIISYIRDLKVKFLPEREDVFEEYNNRILGNTNAQPQQIGKITRKTNNLGIRWQVNRDIFAYFMGKKQFVDYDKSIGDTKFNQLLLSIKQSLKK